ncbi:MAG: OmpH family outer membrane protein [Bacteroidota bacterium]|nr:OmpH family outer membrane protein [Bacteroidota bacterium]
MKRTSLIVEIVLAIAIVVLYILHFTGNKCASDKEPVKAASTEKAVPGKIAYVNIDTVIHQYSMFVDLREKLTVKQKQLGYEMNAKSKTYQNSVQDYQNKVQKGLITRANAAEMEQQLGAEQQKLIQTRDQYQMQLAEEEQVMNRQVLNSIMEYLKEYNKGKKYEFILGNSFGSNLLYADNSLDITAEVVKGLNEKYKSVSKEKK